MPKIFTYFYVILVGVLLQMKFEDLGGYVYK
jgi:hypothetical protein